MSRTLPVLALLACLVLPVSADDGEKDKGKPDKEKVHQKKPKDQKHACGLDLQELLSVIPRLHKGKEAARVAKLIGDHFKRLHPDGCCHCNCHHETGSDPVPQKGNNGVGNGEDPQPPGNPPVNDGPGTGPGNPGNRGGKGKADHPGKGKPGHPGKGGGADKGGEEESEGGKPADHPGRGQGKNNGNRGKGKPGKGRN